MSFFNSHYRCITCKFDPVPCNACAALIQRAQRFKNNTSQCEVMVKQCSNCGNYFSYFNGTASYECKHCGQINMMTSSALLYPPKQNEPETQPTIGVNNKQILTELIEAQEKEIEQLTKAVDKLTNSVAALKLARDIIK